MDERSLIPMLYGGPRLPIEILEDIEGGGFDDDEFGGEDELLGLGGLDEFGGDEELGAPRRRRKKGGLMKALEFAVNPLAPIRAAVQGIQGAQRRSKQKKQRRAEEAKRSQLQEHDPQPGGQLLRNNQGMAAIAGMGGIRFIREAGCTLTIPPIPIDARVPSGVMRLMLRDAAKYVPNAPLTAQVTGVGTATIAMPPPLPVWPGVFTELQFALIRVDIGLPGVTAAAGSQVTLGVYTQQILPLIAGPEPFQASPGAYDSGDITITLHRNIEVASLVLIPWRIVQAQPLPRFARICVQPTPDPANPILQHNLTIQVSAAPAGCQTVLTLCGPTHPTWQSTAAALGDVL